MLKQNSNKLNQINRENIHKFLHLKLLNKKLRVVVVTNVVIVIQKGPRIDLLYLFKISNVESFIQTKLSKYDSKFSDNFS